MTERLPGGEGSRRAAAPAEESGSLTPVEALRIKHRMQVVVALRDQGALSRVELTRRIALSPTTLTKVVGDLVERGWIKEAEARRNRELGRPQIDLQLVPNGYQVLVVVIDPDAARLAAVGLDLEPLFLERHELPTRDARATLEQVAGLVKRFRRAHAKETPNLRSMSVVVPGGTDTKLRTVLWSRQLGWQNMDVADALEAACGLPVVVHNNTRAMGFAEFRVLKLHEDQPMLFLQARFGLGASMVNSATNSLHGHYGVSELAYIPLGINRFAEKAPTPDKHLVRVLTETYLQTVLEAKPSDGPVIALLESRRAAGDAVARKLYEQTVDNLARALGVAVDILHPRVVVLGGVYANASGAFVEALALRLREYAQPEHTGGLVVQCSRLGAIGALQGGAMVAFDHVLLDPATYEFPLRP